VPEDPAYNEEVPEVFVRCLLCGETMGQSEYEFHECDVIPWEDVDG
jgi:hypothetical protein